MSHRPRVLWLTKGLDMGGAERLAVTLVPLLVERGFDVDIAYVLGHKDALVAQLRRLDLAVRCLGAPQGGGVWWPWRLRRLLRHGGYDLVHSHSPLTAAAARILARRADPVLLHTEHNVWPAYHVATRVANAATYGRNAVVIAVSHAVAGSINRPRWAPWLAMPPVEVVLHGIDELAVRRGEAARRAARETLRLSDDDVVLATVANFTPKKDHATLLGALQLLAGQHPRLRLVLIGSGPLEAELRAQTVRDGTAERVLFVGSRDDVQELLPAFDVFVLSSLHEGLSIALLEAMAARVPCVATSVGGVPEVISDGHNGLLAPAGDAGLLAGAISRLLDHPECGPGLVAEGEQTARRFSIGAAAEQTAVLYDRVLGRIATPA